MTAQNAEDKIAVAVEPVVPVTNAPTVAQSQESWPTAAPYATTLHAFPTSEKSGYNDGKNEQDGPTQTSKNSEEASSDANKHWRKPRNAREFAVQANEVATMILNNEMDNEKARRYTAVARAMAQILSTEVYRARFLKEAPNLSLEE